MADSNKKTCLTCIWVDHFKPREDEIEKGLILGCKKPNYEGYTSVDNMACDGMFYKHNNEVCINED